MLFVLGLLIVFGSVSYGFVMAEGQLLTLWQPFEILIIVGAALGAFILANPWHVVLHTIKAMPQVIMGSKVNKDMHMDVLSLLYDILNKARREGIMSIEADVEKPESSAIFARYPTIKNNIELIQFIADYFRIISAGNLTPYELESLMEQEIDARLQELERPAIAVNRIADALPGFGIVAAVLGIVITMGAIGGDISTIGAHIAAALVGTFSGVLLSYGMVGPIGSVLRQLAEDEIKMYESTKACIIASLNGMAPPLAVEFGRKSLFTHNRPTFGDMEKRVRGR
ncbi:MAG: flagellar motor stator protein MotA [Oleibacter sp.]|nr:flagellar motor stator protein MotA [Thalassolituus sp.]